MSCFKPELLGNTNDIRLHVSKMLGKDFAGKPPANDTMKLLINDRFLKHKISVVSGKTHYIMFYYLILRQFHVFKDSFVFIYTYFP
jgi:hypothetical protein